MITHGGKYFTTKKESGEAGTSLTETTGAAAPARSDERARFHNAQPYRSLMPADQLTVGDDAATVAPRTESTGTAIPQAFPPVGEDHVARASAQRGLWRHAARGLVSISIDPAVLQGRPAFRNTRIAVSQVLDVFADVRSIDGVVDQFLGQVDAEAVKEALLFAARLSR